MTIRVLAFCIWWLRAPSSGDTVYVCLSVLGELLPTWAGGNEVAEANPGSGSILGRWRSFVSLCRDMVMTPGAADIPYLRCDSCTKVTPRNVYSLIIDSRADKSLRSTPVPMYPCPLCGYQQLRTPSELDSSPAMLYECQVRFGAPMLWQRCATRFEVPVTAEFALCPACKAGEPEISPLSRETL